MLFRGFDLFAANLPIHASERPANGAKRPKDFLGELPPEYVHPVDASTRSTCIQASTCSPEAIAEEMVGEGGEAARAAAMAAAATVAETCTFRS